MQIRHESGIEGAAQATGATVVIDVFRAFSAAAYALAAGGVEIILTREVGEARSTAMAFPGAVLMGEVAGARPDGFALGNSPGEIVANPAAVVNRTVVHRSSAGTQCALAALEAGAGPLYVASLVVASATAAAVTTAPAVTIVTSGESGVGASEEDQICAEVIHGLLHGDRSRLATSGREVAACDRASFLRDSSFAHPRDVALCANTDAFGFAMRAEPKDGLVRVRRVEV